MTREFTSSDLLIDEQPITFTPTSARILGNCQRAIILQRLHNLISGNFVPYGFKLVPDSGRVWLAVPESGWYHILGKGIPEKDIKSALSFLERKHIIDVAEIPVEELCNFVLYTIDPDGMGKFIEKRLLEIGQEDEE